MTNHPWTRFKDQRPTKAGLYEWRVPSSTAPDMVLIVAAEMRMRGAGGTDVLSPEFDYWDGYRVLVQCDVEWRPTDFVPGKYQRTPAVLGIEGLELSRCSCCGTVPGITAYQAHPQGGVLSNPAPWRLNSWKFVCCAWGETPTMNDPREIERLRRQTRSADAPELLNLLNEAVELQRKNYGDGMILHMDMAEWAKKAETAIHKAKRDQT